MRRSRLEGNAGVAAFVALAGLTAAVAPPAHAQTAVTATIVPYGNRFECVAAGTNVPISGPFWNWQVYIDGSLVDGAAVHTVTGIPWIETILSVDVIEPPGVDLHGYHTCEFVGHDIGGAGPISKTLWDASAAYTFP